MARRKQQSLFLGTGGKVLALDAATGTEIWRTKLKATGTVLLHRDETHLYASISGELFCLDPDSGSIKWHNKLKGLGLGLVSMVTTPKNEQESSQYITIAEQRRQAAAHSAG